ncbi:replication termination factor 2 [Plectropomus leopardus]|uniref:replication termination factor 2 n=1 Tax=Plectropomus leopardus TaxID=160734 RepID=UPI001C4AA1AC|nr:replication termination factor 2 [Plectropomus leopardus]
MGCDGGTIPKRHELVKGPKKVEKVDKNAELAAKWKYCALSQEKLRRPIVSCDLGRLYNKDAIIEYLLDKTAERPNAEAVAHIRGIKDIKELNLTDNPEWEGERRNTKGDRYEDIHCGMFICPVVGLEMNGKHRFCYLQTCGCVFSDRALKEVKTEICHKCGDAFKDEDIVVLNGTKEEVEKLREKMEEKRIKAKTKKSKKSKAAETVSTPSESKDDAQSSQADVEGSSLQNGGESRQSAVAGSSGFSSSSKGTKSSTSSATKRSIQEMTEKSEAFKSLFTTHSSAKRTKDQTSNWVTHTPYHF